ncbi:MAG: hypothetical protein ACE5FK_00470 [Candidatus Methylomirabilia bacterium]
MTSVIELYDEHPINETHVLAGDLQNVARRLAGTFSGTLEGSAIDGRRGSP